MVSSASCDCLWFKTMFQTLERNIQTVFEHLDQKRPSKETVAEKITFATHDRLDIFAEAFFRHIFGPVASEL